MPDHTPGGYSTIWNRAAPVGTATFPSAMQVVVYFIPSVAMTVFGVSWYFVNNGSTVSYAFFQEDGQSQFCQYSGFYGFQRGTTTSGWSSAFLGRPQKLTAGHHYIMGMRIVNNNAYGYMIASRASGVATVHGDVTFVADTPGTPNAGTINTCQQFWTGTLSGRIPCLDILYRK